MYVCVAYVMACSRLTRPSRRVAHQVLESSRAVLWTPNHIQMQWPLPVVVVIITIIISGINMIASASLLLSKWLQKKPTDYRRWRTVAHFYARTMESHGWDA